MLTCYAPSKNYSLSGLIEAIVLGILSGMILGFLYNFFSIVISIVIVKPFVTIAFAIAVGYMIKYILRLSKVRNILHSRILCFLIAWTFFHFQWIAFFIFIEAGEVSIEAYRENFQRVFDPVYFFQQLIDLNNSGPWSLFGAIFKGPILWSVWFVEVLILIGIPMFIIWVHPVVPFSEKLNKWYPKYTLKFEFERIANVNAFRENLFTDPGNTIGSLDMGYAGRYSEVSLYFLKQEHVQYLSVDNVLIDLKGKKDIFAVTHLVEVDNTTIVNLIDRFGIRKNSILDY